MNITRYNTYWNGFKREIGIGLWKYIEQQWLKIWYFFESESDLIELARTNETEFIALVDKLTRSLTQKTSKINDNCIIQAIAISLYNSHFDTRRIKTKDTYISKLFISQDTAREILGHYGQFMSNPLAFTIDDTRMYKSLIQGKDLEQINTYTKNGINNPARISWALATKQQYNQLHIESVKVELYHPTVWHILKERKLQEYSHLFIKAQELCQKWIWNSTQKHQKMQEVLSSTSITKINTIQSDQQESQS